MRVALVGADLEENLAVRYLATPLVRAGHSVEIVGFDTPEERRQVVGRLRMTRPELIGMSVAFQHRLGDFRALARDLRAASVNGLLVWGGHIPTARPGQILDGVPEVDVVVRHDGEQTLVDVAAALVGAPLPVGGSHRVLASPVLERLSRVSGVAFRLPGGRPGATPPREVPRDLDTLDLPLRSGPGARHLGLGFAPILGSRGCWQSCTYCSIHTYHRGRTGPRVRLRSPEAIAAEMASLYRSREARIFCFHDENFFLPKPAHTLERLRSLRLALDGHGVGKVSLVAKCRPDELSRELLHEARRMGVVRLYVGVENGSQAGLDHLGRRTTVAACARALDLLRDAGVFACFNVLLFEPDTTLTDIDENLSFLRGSLDFPWNFCRTEVYPGSVLEQRLRDAGRLRGGLDGMTYTIEDPRVERLFRITAVAFGPRNFGEQSTANALSGIGYLAALLAWFHPGPQARAFGLEVLSLTRALGADTLEKLTRARRFVSASGRSDEEVVAFTEALAEEVARADAWFWPRMEELRRQMEAWARPRSVALLAPVRGLHMARTAAMMAAAVAVQGCTSPVTNDQDAGHQGVDTQVVDPAPPDATFDVQVVDPLPPDAATWDVLDPLPPDVGDALDAALVDEGSRMEWDSLPPDAGADTADVPLVWDPLPPDVLDAWSDAPLPDDVPDAADAPTVVDPPPPDVTFGDLPRAERSGPLDRSFRVRMEARRLGDSLDLCARVTGEGEATVTWVASGGVLEMTGPVHARFTPDGSTSPFILVRARAGTSHLDVARHIPAAHPS